MTKLMEIRQAGGEFALIERLSRIVHSQRPDVLAGIGDDAAVLRVAPPPAPYLLVTTDTLVAGTHFDTRWSTPLHVGIKSAECNLSDIAAMGGEPNWMFVSLVLQEKTEISWVESLYTGLQQSCSRHHVAVVGGDTTTGPAIVINIVLLGTVAERHLCLRSHAQLGDLLVVTGPLGASAAALALLKAGDQPTEYLMEKHLAPHCRLDASRQVAALAGAMIDISDGLGSEVGHICRQSRVGAEIDSDAVPLHPDVRAAAERLGVDPLSFALSGGEDYELLFSLPPDRLDTLSRIGADFHVVGRITALPGQPVLIMPDGRRVPVPQGYNHFG